MPVTTIADITGHRVGTLLKAYGAKRRLSNVKNQMEKINDLSKLACESLIFPIGNIIAVPC